MPRVRPAWVTVIVVTVLQHVTAKFFFIKKEAGTRDLNNRWVGLFWYFCGFSVSGSDSKD